MIYVTGDVHGDINRFSDPTIKKLKKDDTLIVCGDFGFLWNGNKKEKKALEQISKLKFTTLFIDGEHENFDMLNECKSIDFCGGKVGYISDNVYHLQRGQIYVIEGKTIFSFGGGESSDKEDRCAAGTWWECELPSIDEMKLGVSKLDSIGRHVDFIVTHEPPAKIKRLISKSSPTTTNTLNAFFDDLSENVAYDRWFFGSTHMDKNISVKHRAIFLDIIPMYK